MFERKLHTCISCIDESKISIFFFSLDATLYNSYCNGKLVLMTAGVNLSSGLVQPFFPVKYQTVIMSNNKDAAGFH